MLFKSSTEPLMYLLGYFCVFYITLILVMEQSRCEYSLLSRASLKFRGEYEEIFV